MPYHHLRSSAMAAPKPTARLEARIPRQGHTLLKRAAEIEGRTLTDFVVSAARSAALETVEKTELIRLPGVAHDLVPALLIDPPAPNAAMQSAKKHHRRLFGQGCAVLHLRSNCSPVTTAPTAVSPSSMST